MAAAYSFPPLPPAEVVTCLAELGCTVTEAQLAKPEAEWVGALFEELVCLLVGVSREELQQPVFGALNTLQYPELHEESIGVLSFTRHLYRLMFASGITDFSLKDVYSPDPKRLQRCLSAVLNFAKYREDKLQLLQDFKDAAVDVHTRHAELTQAHSDKTAELERLEAEREAAAPAVRQLEAENRALELRLAELQEEQENQACAIRDAKAEALDAADKGAATKAALQAAKAEAEGLRSQIVSAPEAAVTALAEVQAAVERARGRVTAAEAQARAQHGRREALASLEKEIRKASGVAGEAQHAVLQRKEASGVLKLAQQRMQENEAEGYRIESEQQHLERTLATLAERQARLEQQGELKREAAATALRAAEEEATAARQRAEASSHRVAANTAAARQLEAATSELQRTHRREQQAVDAKYRSLVDAVKEYHIGLADEIDAPEEVSEELAIVDATVAT